MEQIDRTDVLIVGAGPTGLLLGCELARRGVAFQIIDRAPAPSKMSRALGVHCRTLEIMEDFGLAQKFIEAGSWLSAISVYRNRELINRIPLEHSRTESEPFSTLLILGQDEVERILTEYLADHGICVQRGYELTELSQNDAEVRVTLSGDDRSRHLSCRYLVGCDGPRSQVRQSLGIPFVGFTYPKAYTLAEAEMEWELDSEMYRFMGEKADLVAIPLGGNRFRLTAWTSLKQEEISTEETPVHGLGTNAPSLEMMQELVDDLVPGEARVKSAEVLLRYKIELRLAANYSMGRCFIAGDACHVHPPTGAQGMNIGIQDAYNLGWKLASVVNGDCPTELLDSYEAERRPVGHWVLNSSNQATVTRFEVGDSRFFMLGRKCLMARWNQLSVNYRNSPIVAPLQNIRRQPDLQAGDRAPDGMIGSPPQRLFELFSGTDHHLLLVADEPERIFANLITQMRDRYGRWLALHLISAKTDGYERLTANYSVHEPTVFLIRPDGYIGVRVGLTKIGFLLSYLENCFLAPNDTRMPA